MIRVSDQALPACGKCLRTGKACGGYRDLADLLFINESRNVSRRVSAISEDSSNQALPITQPSSPEKESSAQTFFFNHFVTTNHLPSLEGINPDAFLLKPIMACALAAMSNKNKKDSQARQLARRHYVDAIAATNIALKCSRRVKEDNTLIAVFLLGVFEVTLLYTPVVGRILKA